MLCAVQQYQQGKMNSNYSNNLGRDRRACDVSDTCDHNYNYRYSSSSSRSSSSSSRRSSSSSSGDTSERSNISRVSLLRDAADSKQRLRDHRGNRCYGSVDSRRSSRGVLGDVSRARTAPEHVHLNSYSHSTWSSRPRTASKPPYSIDDYR